MLVKSVCLLVSCIWRIFSVRGGEETSYSPHIDGKQGKLIWQLEDTLFQVAQEARLLRPNLHPARYLWLLQERLQDQEQVARILILVHGKLVEPWAFLPREGHINIRAAWSTDNQFQPHWPYMTWIIVEHKIGNLNWWECQVKLVKMDTLKPTKVFSNFKVYYFSTPVDWKVRRRKPRANKIKKTWTQCKENVRSFFVDENIQN